MAAHRFGRRPLARHLVTDWALALVLAALLLAVLTIAGCAPGDGADDGADVSRTTLPGVRADGSETGWWVTLAVDDDGHAQPVDLSAPPGELDAADRGPGAPPVSPSRLVLPADLLFFETDSATVGPDGGRLLDEVAAWLLATGAPVAVVGHTDATGTDAYNLQLGRARAEAVAAGLRDRGVPAERLVSVTSEGEGSPVDTNDTGAGRARNRRVELVLNPAA